MTAKIWYTGKNDYRKLLFTPGEGLNFFSLELIEPEEIQNFNNIHEAFAYNLEGANLPVEVLYSGGIDSETVLISCLVNKIPATALTMRLMFKGCPINTHDLYYSEKFCREHGIEQSIVDLDIESFFGNGDHLKYLTPYYLRFSNVAAHMWLIEQANRFPILGGDYTWPQLEVPLKTYSPHRNEFQFYDVFMKDNGVTGIGNMISHSFESNLLFVKEHINIYNQDPAFVGGDAIKIIAFKQRLTENLGFGILEPRQKSFGWEMTDVLKPWFDPIAFHQELLKDYYYTASCVKWNETMGSLIGRGPGENYSYGYGNW